MAPRSSTMTVRAVANSVSRKILYFEAGKGFVDMLLCFLQLPFAVFFRILSTQDSSVPRVGCLTNAYESLCSLIRSNGSAEISGLPYVVTDELEIRKISNTMESVELFKKLKIRNVANLWKLKTSITKDEVLQLFKCSLTSKVVLNLVFGRKVYVNPAVSPDSMKCRTQLVKVDPRSISVHFLVKRSSQQIMYMEVGEEFITVLESFLNTPVVWLLKELSSGLTGGIPEVGSMSRLYRSVSMLSNDFFLVPMKDVMDTDFKKARVCPNVLLSLLRPAATCVYACSRMHSVSFLYKDRCDSCKDDMTLELKILDKDVPQDMVRLVHRCNKSVDRCACVSYTHYKWCTSCGEFMDTQIPIVFGGIGQWPRPPAQEFQGYVRKNLSFVVSDDLEILPMSSLNNIALLSKGMVSRMENIHSFEVSLTITEALELLKASFTSGEALTTVFGEQIDQRMPQPSALDCACMDFLMHWWNSDPIRFV